MSAHVNRDSGPAVRRALVDPASARPQPQPATDGPGTLPRPAGAVAAGAPTNGRVAPGPSSGAAPGAGGSDRRPPVPVHAGVVTRLLAAAVDAVVVLLLTAMLDLAAAGARFLWSPVDFRWPRPTVATTVGALLLVAVVYLAAAWALTGRTYGARLLGLRVLSSGHQLLGWIRSVVRAVVSVLWPVGLLWCGISRTRLSLADVVLRTVVVYDTQPFAHVRGDERPRAPERAPDGGEGARLTAAPAGERPASGWPAGGRAPQG